MTAFSMARQDFIDYIDRESNILHLDDFSSRRGDPDNDTPEKCLIGFKCGDEYRVEDFRKIFLSAGFLHFGADLSEPGTLRAGLMIAPDCLDTHLNILEEHKDIISETFHLENIATGQAGNRIYFFSVEKNSIDLSSLRNWESEFRWVRETLEKLYYVLRVHDEIRGTEYAEYGSLL